MIKMATLILLASLAACVPQTSDTAGAPVGPGICPATIEIRDFAFQPANCSVEAGATLTFVNRDSAPHTATSQEGAAASFDTGTLQQGQSATVTLTEPGDYPYFCTIHPGMQALITVNSAAGAANEDEDASGSGPGADY